MTTSELSLEQMKRLAEIVTGETAFAYIDEYVDGSTEDFVWIKYSNPDEAYRFNPSLTGEDWQQAQALDVLKAYTQIDKYKFTDKEPYAVYEAIKTGILNRVARDLLHASALAILGDKT